MGPREAGVEPAHPQTEPQPPGSGQLAQLGTHVLPDHRLSRCKLPDLVCRDLSEALTELGLFHSWLSEAGLRALSEGLAWPQCRLQTLRWGPAWKGPRRGRGLP